MNISKLKTLQIMHAAFCASIFSFGIMALVVPLGPSYINVSFDNNDVLYPLFPIMSLVFVISGILLFKKLIPGIDNMLVAEEKITRYQTAFLIRSALFEAGALMNITAFFVSPNLIFLIIAGVVFLIFVALRPNRQGVIDMLNLSYPDTEKI